jgi:ornithine--oxo-acid transaminase
MCRTGRDFCVDWEGVKPDLLVLGKALGGGIMPVSAVVGRKEFMEVFKPGTHGSTFGGNPLACAIGREVLKLIREEHFSEKSAEQGAYFLSQLMSLNLAKVNSIRGKGLFLGVDVKPEFGPAYGYCEKLLGLGLLCKDTRTQTVRFAPPLTITKAEIDLALEKIVEVLN